jgi:hypothetical protein
MFKNVASQKFRVFAFDATTNVPKTGDAANLTAYVSKDYGAVTVLTDTSASEEDATNAPGYYLFDAAQAETNADVLMVSGKSATTNIKLIGAPAVIFPRPAAFGLVAGAAGGLFIAGTNAATTITTALTTTFTGNLTGSVASVTAGVTLAASAIQAIWDALTSALTTVGSIGKLLVDNVNATISSRLATAGYTAPLDAAGTRSAVGLVAANLDTQLDALPTNSELATALAAADDAVLAAIAALPVPLTAAGIRTAVGLASANLDTQLDALPTNAELATSQAAADDATLAAIAALQTSVDDVPTNAELATALASADDATLAQVALVKAKTDLIPASPAAVGSAMTLTSGERDSIAAAHLDLSNGIEVGLTPRQAHRLEAAAAAGKLSGAATSTVVIRNAVADSKPRVTATVDVDGNRTAITTDVT